LPNPVAAREFCGFEPRGTPSGDPKFNLVVRQQPVPLRIFGGMVIGPLS